MSGPYTDAPLSRHKGSQEFRLVELQPNSLSDPIRCILRAYSFDSDPPSYTALSYTWGPKVKHENIELNGACFPVGRSLWAFLEHMRLQSKFGMYWIDAVCIDQESVLERNHQVQMMRQIYANAKTVSIWLGEADINMSSDIAMGFLQEMLLSQGDAGSQIVWSEETARAVSKLLNRPYWSRIWIVQELFLARSIVIFCGSRHCEWRALDHLANTVFRHARINKIIEIGHLKAVQLGLARKLYQVELKYLSLLELLVTFSNHEATNVLDKVYGVCGLARGGTDFIIDYDILPEDLLIRLLYYICTYTTQLERRVLTDFIIVVSATLDVRWSHEEMTAQVDVLQKTYNCLATTKDEHQRMSDGSITVGLMLPQPPHESSYNEDVAARLKRAILMPNSIDISL